MNVRRILPVAGATLSFVGVLALTACGGTSTSPSPRTTPTVASANVPFTTTDVVVGTGATAKSEHMVIVSYTGWLYDSGTPDHHGKQFDSSTSFGFILGIGDVIQGWEQGIPGMKVGGTRVLVVPPELAYGQNANGVIPGNSTLIFQVTLLGAQ